MLGILITYFLLIVQMVNPPGGGGTTEVNTTCSCFEFCSMNITSPSLPVYSTAQTNTPVSYYNEFNHTM